MKRPTDFFMENNKVSCSWIILFFAFIIKKEGKVKAREKLALKRKTRLRWNERTNKEKHMLRLINCFKLNSKSPGTCTKTSPCFCVGFFFHLEIPPRNCEGFSELSGCCLAETKTQCFHHKQLILSCIQEILNFYNIPSTRICTNVGKAEHLLQWLGRFFAQRIYRYFNCCPNQKYSCRNTCIYVYETT